ncbi:FadR/GntR family transcriptional regulator [Neobacillus mesonae]|uniref:FadR/GntR family transcriptional regulator n=1 Tax=Neobacillus mesonae TaxID=1193713 RepID=UPI00203D3234|nr:FadR/GntR family transcriptional regulator [Neobacillus mesonae]MCM3570549.1 FadR family transcriptional regulator [Neobacillus mesonae]
MSEKEKLSQTISRELLSMIELGRFPPGTKLPTEMELASLFGVSRLPIREALSVLRAAGIISSRQGDGSYVEEGANLSLFHYIQIENDVTESIEYLFEMRKILEPNAAYFAALRRTPEQLERIRRELIEMENENEYTKILEADIAFHKAIILAAQNPIMISVWASLTSLYEKALKIAHKPNLELKQRQKAVYQEHLNILDAIEMEEPELARVQCAIHLKNAEKKFSLFF